jgi:hypothetical protein
VAAELGQRMTKIDVRGVVGGEVKRIGAGGHTKSAGGPCDDNRRQAAGGNVPVNGEYSVLLNDCVRDVTLLFSSSSLFAVASVHMSVV